MSATISPLPTKLERSLGELAVICPVVRQQSTKSAFSREARREFTVLKRASYIALLND